MSLLDSIADIAIGGNSVDVKGRKVSEVGSVSEERVSGTVSGSVTLDLTEANVFDYTITGDTSISFTGASGDGKGNSFTLVIRQDSTGGHTLSWPSSVEWNGGTQQTIDGTASTASLFSVISNDGGNSWIALLTLTGVE